MVVNAIDAAARYQPLARVDLADLPVDRLRRFLDAFSAKIHCGHRAKTTRLATELAADAIQGLARLIGAMVAK